MPALPVIADCQRIAINWRSTHGLTAANIIHVNAGAHSESDTWALLDTHWTADMMGTMSADSVIEKVVIEKLDGVSAAQEFGPMTQHTGSGSGDAIAQCSTLVKLTTPLRGRSHRGRIYLPFTGEGNVTEGKLSGGGFVSQGTAWTAFIAAMVADASDIVVASYKLATMETVTGVLVETITATQRRRLDRLR